MGIATLSLYVFVVLLCAYSFSNFSNVSFFFA